MPCAQLTEASVPLRRMVTVLPPSKPGTPQTLLLDPSAPHFDSARDFKPVLWGTVDRLLTLCEVPSSPICLSRWTTKAVLFPLLFRVACGQVTLTVVSCSMWASDLDCLMVFGCSSGPESQGQKCDFKPVLWGTVDRLLTLCEVKYTK